MFPPSDYVVIFSVFLYAHIIAHYVHFSPEMFGYILYKYRVANTVVVDDVFPPQVVDLAFDCVVEKIAEGQHEVLFYSADKG